MHELSITKGILNIVLEEGKKHNVKKITRINLKLGFLSDLVPECISLYFDILSKGTLAEKAKIRVEKLPANIKCLNCNNVWTEEVDNIEKCRCPECSSNNITFTGGREFYIDSMEAE